MSRDVLEEINCKQFVELVTGYLEDQLEAAQREAVEHHHEICPGCQNYVKQMQVTIAALRDLGAEDVSAEAKDAILQAFRERRPPSGNGSAGA